MTLSCPVDRRPVAGSEVTEPSSAAFEVEPGVLAADGVVGEDEVDLAAPTDHIATVRGDERELIALVLSGHKAEYVNVLTHLGEARIGGDRGRRQLTNYRDGDRCGAVLRARAGPQL